MTGYFLSHELYFLIIAFQTMALIVPTANPMAAVTITKNTDDIRLNGMTVYGGLIMCNRKMKLRSGCAIPNATKTDHKACQPPSKAAVTIPVFCGSNVGI